MSVAMCAVVFMLACLPVAAHTYRSQPVELSVESQRATAARASAWTLAELLLAFTPAALWRPACAAWPSALLSRAPRRPPCFAQMAATADDVIECDYLVVGAGASGMAFVDTLLLHAPEPVDVVLLDKRAQPGGHWNDAYSFVTLHQPARNYGVESSALEANVQHPELLASRTEILNYYRAVLDGWQAKGHKVRFIGGSAYDFKSGSYTSSDGAKTMTTVNAGKVVDARYTENDIPLHVPPKFGFSTDRLTVIPPNKLPSLDQKASQGRFCVLGAGKTGQDTMLYLRKVLGVPVENIVWVMPNDPWITARDPPSPLRQNTCMEFIASVLEAHADAGAPAGAASSADFLQRGFKRLEAEGKVYRIDPNVTPTKFMDATLNSDEIEVLRSCVPCIVRHGNSRVASISENGDLVFSDGFTMPLPWAHEDDAEAVKGTTFVHCTAGAFNFGSSAAEEQRPVFSSDKLITVQEIFQFPGFCFNGAVIAWLECQRSLSQTDKNALCELVPVCKPAVPSPLGPVAGSVGPLSSDHPLVVSLRNLRRWYATGSMGEWLHTLRLFSLSMNGYSLEEGRALAESNYDALVALGVMNDK